MSFDLYQWRDAVFASNVSRSVLSTAWALSKWNKNDTGVLYPKHETIAEYSKTPIGTVRRHLKELEKAGLLEITSERKGQARVWTKNTYRMVFPDNWSPSVSTSPEEEEQDFRPSVSTSSARTAEEVVDLCAEASSSAVDNDALVRISEPTSAHLEPDYCAFSDGLVRTSARYELPRELPNQLPREKTSTSDAKTAPTREADSVVASAPTRMDRPLMAVVPDLSPEQNEDSLDDRGHALLSHGFDEARDYLNDHRPGTNPLSFSEEVALREELRRRTAPSIIFSMFTGKRVSA